MSVSQAVVPRVPRRLKLYMRLALETCSRVRGTVDRASPLRAVKVARLRRLQPLKLNVGCGRAKHVGWVNIDIEPGSDLTADIRNGLPFDDDSVDFIHNEHVMEHLTFEEGSRVFKDFFRCLKKGGVARIAMPDLDYIVSKYNGDWQDQDWLRQPGHESINSRGLMINACFRSWEHRYLYNEEDLRNQLSRAGFQKIERCTLNQRAYEELRGLETRSESRLILEATK